MADDRTITIPEPGQAKAPPDFSGQAVVQLSSGQRVVGPREGLPGLLQDDPGAKEIPLGTQKMAVRLSNGRVVIGPKANLPNLAQDDPGARIVAGSISGVPSRAITPEQQQQLEEFNPANNEPTGALGVAAGVAKGAVETMKGTLNLAGKAAGKEKAGDETIKGMGGQPIDTEAKTPSQTIGKVGESILEFVAGDEALKGLSLADRLGMAHASQNFSRVRQVPRLPAKLSMWQQLPCVKEQLAALRHSPRVGRQPRLPRMRVL